jgi:hypothetical protein
VRKKVRQKIFKSEIFWLKKFLSQKTIADDTPADGMRYAPVSHGTCERSETGVSFPRIEVPGSPTVAPLITHLTRASIYGIGCKKHRIPVHRYWNTRLLQSV